MKLDHDWYVCGIRLSHYLDARKFLTESFHGAEGEVPYISQVLPRIVPAIMLSTENIKRHIFISSLYNYSQIAFVALTLFPQSG